jgi:Tfp pilus assembly protein PilO
MNTDKIKEILDKIPTGVLLVLALGYIGWGYYDFTTSPESPLQTKASAIVTAKEENEKLQKKIDDGKSFLKSLDAKKTELRKLAADLDMMKGTLTETIDVGDFDIATRNEAKRVGLTILKFQPAQAEKSQEFYAEKSFDYTFRGVYVQLLVFFERMSNLQKIVRVDNFEFKPLTKGSARYVELEAKVQVKAYRYLASKADQLGRDKPDAPAVPPKPAVAPAKPKGGT